VWQSDHVSGSGTPDGAVATAAPDALAPPPRHPRFPLLDGMRAVAALCIVLHHVSLIGPPDDETVTRVLRGLSIGVPIFFLISGFLLYRPFIAHRSGGAASPAIHDYARRRLLRIFPAFWAILAVLLVAPGISAYNGVPTIWEPLLLHQLPLPGNSPCEVTTSTCGLAQTWSLTVEVTFYAILPLYVVAAGALASNRGSRQWLRNEMLLLLTLSVASLVLAHFTVEPNQLSWAAGSVLGYVFWFALGMALALVSVALGNDARISRLANRHAGRLWLAAGILFAAVVIVIPPVPNPISAGERTLTAVAAGLISLFVLVPAIFSNAAETAIGRFLSWRICAWLGLISYGIFLWHFVVVLKLGEAGVRDFVPLMLSTIAITIGLAAASYYIVERPSLKFKYARNRPPRAPAPSQDSTPSPVHDPAPYPPAGVGMPDNAGDSSTRLPDGSAQRPGS
jgi:peptidoglycan/LPS O-acetylase OafA/YrhL